MENTDFFDIEQNQKDTEEIFASFKKFEEEGKQNTKKYFDRIHDKLFSLNTVLIAGFIAIIMLCNVPKWIMILPVFNMLYLIWIEHRLMESSRIQASFTLISKDKRDNFLKSGHKITLLSLISIILTIIVAFVFVFFLSKIKS